MDEYQCSSPGSPPFSPAFSSGSPTGAPAVSALQPKPNMHFNPAPTNPGKCSKLKIDIMLNSTTYVAGRYLHGRLEVEASTNTKLKLGEIAVDLAGFEEITDKEYAASRSFLTARTIFQGANKPPSQAVRGQAENGYWQANKRKTTFPFSFKLPLDAPSSFAFQSVASLRYVVSGSVQYQYNGRNDVLCRSKEAFVVEYWRANHPDMREEPIRARNHRRVWMGGAGEVHLEGTIKTSLFVSGNDVYVEVRVKNESKRRVQGIRMSLVRKLLMIREGTPVAADIANDVKILTESVAEKQFKERDFIFDPGEERSSIIHINIPTHAISPQRFIRTVRNTALAEIACRVVVTLSMGTFFKDLTIELPINICHSASIQPPPEVNPYDNAHPDQYNLMSEDEEELYSPPRARHLDIPSRDGKRGIASPTFRARSMSPNRVESPPKGVRALPWSDDEEDAEDFDRKRRSRQQQQDGGVSSSPEESGSPFFERPPGGFLRDVEARSPPTFARTARKKGLIVKSPLVGPASPIAYTPATERSRYISHQSVLLDMPASPNQETEEIFGSPTSQFSQARSIDPLSLPSPVMSTASPPRRPAAFHLTQSGFYDPPQQQQQQYAYSTSPQDYSRASRPLPDLPPLDSPTTPQSPGGYGYMGYFLDKARQVVSYAAYPIFASPTSSPPPPEQPIHRQASPPQSEGTQPSPPRNENAYPTHTQPVSIPSSPHPAPHQPESAESVPAQYRGMSPPLSPRPQGYVSKYRREPKPLPPQPVSPTIRGGVGGLVGSPVYGGPYSMATGGYPVVGSPTASNNPPVPPRQRHSPPKQSPPKPQQPIAEQKENIMPIPTPAPRPPNINRYSTQSQISEIPRTSEESEGDKYLDVDFDFGDMALFDFDDATSPKLSTLKTRGRKRRPGLGGILHPPTTNNTTTTTGKPPSSTPIPIPHQPAKQPSRATISPKVAA
ncbi:hypothetical protein HK104_002391, partial [Borealophlyctis nickersoniae]